MLVVVLLVAVTYLGVRSPARGKFDALPVGPVATAVYLLVAVGLILMVHTFRRSRHAVVRHGVWLGSLAVTLLVAAMAIERGVLWWETAHAEEPWPPQLEVLAKVDVDALSPLERAEWAARVAAHHALDGGRVDLPITVPPDWPFPDDAQIGILERSDSEVEVWARTADGTASCVPLLLALDMVADSAARRARCDRNHQAPAEVRFARPARRPDPARSPSDGPLGEPWAQYRGGMERPGREGQLPDAGVDSAWRVAIDGRIRASVGGSAGLVVIGGHGTGSLTAVEAATGRLRWIARLPNWIHQDPVTDGRVVVVGFGDNDEAFQGRSPSGVAGYDLATGRRLWSAFDQGSVMTTPAIDDSILVYATGAGLVRARALRTGRLLAADTLPGSVTMAPPAMIGDTVVFTMDHGGTCALRADDLATLWCHDFPDLRLMGHAAPAIHGHAVIVSGGASARSPRLGEWLRMDWPLRIRLLREMLFPVAYEIYAGQVFAALDLHDGHLLWRSPVIGNPRQVPGHIAGTATIVRDRAVIVLPIADTVVAFDPATGAVRWMRGAHGARGPALVVDGQVVVAGRDGVLTSYALDTGVPLCRHLSPVGSDRAGPTVIDAMVILPHLDGVVEGLPLRDLLACRGPSMQPSPGAR